MRLFPRSTIGTAMCAVLTVLPGAVGAVGTAYAAGPTPSPDQIATAKAQAAKTAAKLVATARQLKNVQVQLTRMSDTAELAVAQWQAAQAAATDAQTVLTATQAAADAAAATVAGYRSQLNDYAVAAYKDGGPIGELAAMVNASGPQDVMTRNTILEQIGLSQSRIVGQFVTASDAAATTKAVATQASTSAQQLLDKAGSAKTTAASAVQLAQSLLAKVESAKQQLTLATSRDNKHVTALIKQRAEELALARAAAARAAAEKLQQLAPISGFPEATPQQGALAMRWAQAQIGVPYSWGGGDAGGPTLGFAEDGGITAGLHTVGFDCSGLTLFAWAHAGYALGHYTGAQWVEGTAIAADQLRPGDLLFFATDVTDPTTIHHVGVYAGNGQMIDAPETGAVVRYDPAFNDEYIGAIRP